MKKLLYLIVLALILSLVLTGSSQSLVQLDDVNIGDTTSEIGHDLVGWTLIWTCGPYSVPLRQGNWCACHADGNMRLIWGDGGETCASGNNSASVDLNVNCDWAQTLKVEHLDGAGDDGFDVFVNGIYIDTYEATPETDNVWYVTNFDISPWNFTGELTIEFVATGSAWEGCETYGQVAFNTIKLWGGLVSATVDIDPDELNLNARGKWITAYIELPSGYDVNDIDINNVELCYGTNCVKAELKPTKIGDHDLNGVDDLMVKFDRATVAGWLQQGDIPTFTLTGITVGGICFEGSDTITTITED